MYLRLFYWFCFLFFLVALYQKIEKDRLSSPQEVVGAPFAHAQHLDGSGVVVAVLDEGFDHAHTSLTENFSPYRYNAHNETRDVAEPLVYENGQYIFESHGTHVSGIIANLAPHVKIIPIKVEGFGGDQAFVKALRIAALSPAHIVNISLRLSYTGRKMSPNVREALVQLATAGKLIVISAGNDASPLMQKAYTRSLVELAFNPLMEGRLLLAGASSLKNEKEELADFSNYPGENASHLAQTYFITAPGDQITSTITGGHFGKKSGTSMAAPMVVGAACLVKQAFPHLSAEALAHLLLTSARKTSLNGEALSSTFFGAGIVNVKSALEEGKVH